MEELENNKKNRTVDEEDRFKGRRRKHVHMRGRAALISLTIDGRRGKELHEKEKQNTARGRTSQR